MKHRFVPMTVVCSVVLLSTGTSRAQQTGDETLLSSSTTLGISAVAANHRTVACYDKLEITFQMGGTWENPFNPDEIAVDAEFAGPQGERYRVPAFFFQEYRRIVSNGRETYIRTGDPCWKVRFAPPAAGEYRCVLTAVNKDRIVQMDTPSFRCTPNSNNHGYLRISSRNPLYFEYEDGTPFFAVAMDAAVGPVYRYEHMYSEFARSGGNFNRLFLTHGNFNIFEQITDAPGSTQPFGRLHLDNCWSVDQVLELGERLSIYHMLTLTNQTNTKAAGWDRNVFNVKNGGFLENAGDYFTDERALQAFERVLRYSVARWGYSTAVFSWDLWNEVNSAAGFTPEIGAQWHQRMGRYLKSTDAARHVVHTNFGNLNGHAEIDDLPEMEVVSTNVYAVKDIAQVADVWTRRLIDRFRKPYMLSEYGIGHGLRNGYDIHDYDRIMIHNGLWSPLMCGSAGTGMAWGANWVDDHRFYRYTRAVADFVNGVPFSRLSWEPVKVENFSFADPARQPYHADALIEGFPGNYTFPSEAVSHERFIVQADGRLERQDLLHAVLGELKSWQRPDVTFSVTYPVAGQFVVFVSELRGTTPTPQLTVTVDGRVSLQQSLLPLNTTDQYDARMYYQQYATDIPAGAHDIRVANTGGGSIVTSYTLRNYLPKNGPNLEVRGLQSEKYILLWLKHPDFNYMFHRMGIQPEPQDEGRLSLQNVPDGAWLVEWMDTLTGEWMERSTVTVHNNRLSLETPQVTQSVAGRLTRLVDFRTED